MTLNSPLPYLRSLRPLAAVLVAACSLACTIDKNLATASDGEPSTSGAETSTGTTSDDPTSSSGPTTTTEFESPGVSSTGPDDAGDESSTGEPVLGCPDHATIDDCCCFIKMGEEPGASLETVCPVGPMLCGVTDLECPPEEDCNDVNDEAFLDCALSALKGSMAGTISVRIGIDDDTQRSIDYNIVGDGSVYRVDVNRFDFMGTVDTERYTLKSPDFFDACLLGSLAEKADCLIEAVNGEAEEICVPQFGFSDV